MSTVTMSINCVSYLWGYEEHENNKKIVVLNSGESVVQFGLVFVILVRSQLIKMSNKDQRSF